MTISIQPLKSGQPIGPPTITTFAAFLLANDGFTEESVADMQRVLAMGSGYLIGGGATGEYRISKLPIPPIDTSPENLAYISSIKPGEQVIEMGECCMKGRRGVGYISKSHGNVCVMWELGNGEQMGTTVTWGTRRVGDVKP